LWVKEKINPPCCGILIHRRYGSLVGRVHPGFLFFRLPRLTLL
jgi:hypothetical protein